MNKLLDYIEKSDKYVFLPLFISATVVLVILLTFLVTFPLLPPRLPLFYSLPWGQNQLVAKEQFLILPAMLALINLINAFLSSQLHPSQFVLKRILLLSLIILDLTALITSIKIIFIFV